jgi:hypothetical protein
MTHRPNSLALLLGLSIILVSGAATAQTGASSAAASPTRAQVKMDRDEFMKTHYWDAYDAKWILDEGVEPPEGVKTRMNIRAERDEFLRNNRWDNQKSIWIPLGAQPRDLGKMTRVEEQEETHRFAMTHSFNSFTQQWTERTPRVKQ